MLAIETHELSKRYGTHLGRKGQPSIDALNLSVNEGEVFGFLGKNGAGKTTTIKILCGLLRPSKGTARVFGVDVAKRQARKMLGYLPENPYFYEYLTPRETLDFYGRLQGSGRAQRAKEWDMLSEMLDLREIANQRLRGFSKGMRQRIGFAVALVGDPPLLILDEPMSGLDPMGRRNIRELILMMHEQKKTIFFSSHVLGDVEQICTRIGILVDGRLTVEGEVKELLRRRVSQVEVIVRDISDSLKKAFTEQAIRTRTSESGTHFVLQGIDQANKVARTTLDEGGILIEFLPLRESLEDYFVREQERSKRMPSGE